MNDFNGVFDDLSPADFNVEGTSMFEQLNQYENFETFTQAHVEGARHAVLTGGTAYMAVLANPGIVRYFAVVDEEEDAGMFVDRLRTEAKAMKATWLFVSFFSQVGHYDYEADEPKTDDIAVESTDQEMHDGLIWHAERRRSPHSGKENHNGILYVTDDKARLVEQRSSGQGLPIASLILEA